jgi:WD40 repeat protein
MLWDARDGRQRGPATQGAGGSIVQIAFSPDGRRLGIGSFDQTASIWEVGSRNRVGGTFPVAAGVAPGVAFASDGRFILTELGDIVTWPTDRARLQRFACQVAGRDLTRDEWHDLLQNRPYRSVCPT